MIILIAYTYLFTEICIKHDIYLPQVLKNEHDIKYIRADLGVVSRSSRYRYSPVI